MNTSPLLLLTELYGDRTIGRIFSDEETISRWLEVERVLASAQASLGLLGEDDATRIGRAARLEHIDREQLWRESRNVGLPILPLVRQVASNLPEGPGGRLHYGASSHDIMDTALSLQIRAAGDLLRELISQFGDAVAALTVEHRGTMMAARTQGQNAVPTTLGTKLAVYLSQLTHAYAMLGEAQHRAAVVSLYGAVGTSAALGDQAAPVRQEVARRLRLADAPVPWHTARENVVMFGQQCALVAAVCGRFAREVIDLSRTEIRELAEPYEYERGASSTVAQKSNPVFCEAVIGMSAVASGLAGGLYRAVEAEHERAAGEWHIEWESIPKLAQLAGGCLVCAVDVSGGLQVFPEAMRRNMELGGGVIMAEAYMMALAPRLGRNRAHDVVYDASLQARANQSQLRETLILHLEQLGIPDAPEISSALDPETYLGESQHICEAAVSMWDGRASGG